MDVLETFGYMDVIEENNDMIWDPSSIFDENDQQQIAFEDQQQPPPPPPPNAHQQQQLQQQQQQIIGGVEKVEGSTSCSEDLAMMFFEWLKMYKEMVSAEDLRNIKIKRSTIENAAKRLGTGKDGMKRLVKLVLEWVQNHQLQAKQQRIITEDIRPPPQAQVSVLPSFTNQQLQPEPISQNPNPNNPNFINSANSLPPPNPQWIAQPQAVQAVTTAIGYPPPPSMVGIGNMSYHDPFPPTEFHHPHPVMNSTTSQPPWQSQPPQPQPPQLQPQPQPSFPPQYIMPSHYNSFSENNNLLPLHSQPPPTAFGNGYGNQCTYQYFPGNGEKLVRLGSSATKEARQKRMARNRRVYHHRYHHQQQQNHNNQQNQHQMNQTIADQQQANVFIGSENLVTDQAQAQAANPANWVYRPSPPAAAPAASTLSPMVLPVDTPAVQVQANQSDSPSQNYQRQIASEKRQGWKPEKNLRFLLQKVLKQSDVGNLGRIVLPKKEAETHLPELDARDGISIPMEDIGTSRVWNMKYSSRFWPNNKSRMYPLENTGDFVKTNGLQEGDFIVIYSDIKCGKYMIRGVKVRQPGSKSETKKSGGKSNKNQHIHGTATKAGNNSAASSPNKANSSNGSDNDNDNDNDGKMNQKKNKLASSSFIDLKLEAQWCG
uniref:B3 domain-containing transcription factor ABI3 n=1 Tax=Ribes rubrum TaxID=175228 RepID=A0A1L5YFB9_9MAGN|nr:B3 domain-containing transcription factor ABI3 [Ribes rubrum]